MLVNALLMLSLVACLVFLVILKESYFEQEERAVRISFTLLLFTIVIMVAIAELPSIRNGAAVLFIILGILGLGLLIPGRQNRKALKGSMGYAVGKVDRLDESYSVFVRVRGLPDGSRAYKAFYGDNPELEEGDSIRREKGLLGKLGSIDKGYQPNAAMVHASFDMPDFLGRQARSAPEGGSSPASISPEKATKIVKNYARHLGADMVGICKVNPSWIYAKRGEIHYGNWEDWGTELQNLPKYAVVFLLEMDRDHVISAPHTPTVAESAVNYAKGAYISTILGRWFAHMGYPGIAEHSRNYDVILPPLAVDAGLGEIGRQGYLIAPKFGARVRVFAVLTDMPLVVDQPISIGVEEFCEKCLKCADSCPSRSIPKGPKTVCRGIEKWKLDEDSCFDYWSRVGTDCSVCMAICPFSRPNTLFHRMVRWFVAKSALAKTLFPHIDNFLYGKRWKARKVPEWLSYPKRSDSEDYPMIFEDQSY